jgi:hypothetical protein
VQVSGFEPIDYSGMTAVNLPTAATTTGGGGTGGGGTGGGGAAGGGASDIKTAVVCSLGATSRKIAIPSRAKAKHGAHPTLSLRVTCTSTAAALISGRFKVTTKLAHGRTRSRSYSVAATRSQLSAGTARTFLIRVPAAVASAVTNKRQRVAAGFTLQAAGSGGTGHADLTIGRVL